MVHEDPIERYAETIRQNSIGAYALGFQKAIGCEIATLQALATPPKTAALARIKEGFYANIERTMHPLSLPQYVIYWAKCVQLSECIAFFNVTNNPSPEIAYDSATIDKIHHEIMRLQSQLAMQTEEFTFPVDDIRRANEAVVGVMAHSSSAGLGFMAILANAITNLWTAFETLSGDLWETALNVHPKELAALSGKKKGGEKDEPRKIDMSFVERHNYDLSKAMGTVLKSRYKFTNITSTKLAYQHAFPAVFEKIDSIILPEMEILECLRNLLVHRSGVVDEQFLERVKNMPVFPPIQAGETLCVNGGMVSALLNVTIKSGDALFRAVDDWLAEH
jgi:hypothetical protein